MWEQAKTRAEEIGSAVLWCDGGEGGVSGVASQGIKDYMQVGEGWWTRTIGIQWPFNENRTVYSRWGNGYTLLVLWAILGCGWAGGLIVSRKVGLRSTVAGGRGLFEAVGGWWHRKRITGDEQRIGEEQPLLVDV